MATGRTTIGKDNRQYEALLGMAQKVTGDRRELDGVEPTICKRSTYAPGMQSSVVYEFTYQLPETLDTPVERTFVFITDEQGELIELVENC